jgi:hypothetical protein
MFRPLSSLIPNAADLLSLEIEELGALLWLHLNSYEGVANNSVYQNGLISQSNFAAAPRQFGITPEYGNRQPDVDRALMEAWAWLVSQGFLVREPSQPAPWYFISCRHRLPTYGWNRIPRAMAARYQEFQCPITGKSDKCLSSFRGRFHLYEQRVNQMG